MKGKVYFSDGTTKPIVDYAIYSDHDVEFWTEDDHYRYYSCLLDEEVYTGTAPKTIYKHRVHHFYKIELLSGKYKEVRIDKIEIMFGKGE